MQPLGVGGVDVRDFEVKNCYESSGRDWSSRSAPIGGEGVCLKWVIERFEKIVVKAISINGFSGFEKFIIDWSLLIPENTQHRVADEAIRPCGRLRRLSEVNI
ncbi:hypothetical protein TNCV_2222951 [Trichonephila clavipes]|nr:hypothetical protein TNCV_2222951 [Trichonephila clavipes]